MSEVTKATAAKKSPTWKGLVVSDKMTHTIVVAVETLKTHRKYGKKYLSTKHYKVHDPNDRYKEGDLVVFQECSPKSKDKHHSVVEE